MAKNYKTPDQIHRAYESGLPGWQEDPDGVEDLLCDRKVETFAAAATHLAGIGRGKRALLWRSREKFDPGAFGQERQTTGDCVSHGSRNAREVTRCVEIHIKGEPEEFYCRSATEPTYGSRGHGGQGMSPAVATRFEVDYGFLFRKAYGFVDLSQYNARIGAGWGRSGVPAEVKEACRENNVGRHVAPESAEQTMDLMQGGYAVHSGQSFGVKSTSDARGIAVPSGRWNHDMATVGYDDTREVYPECVFLIANSWGRWNNRPRVWPEEVYGPWPEGSFWVTEEVYDRWFVGSRSIFAYCDIAGVPLKNIPDWGTPKEVLG